MLYYEAISETLVLANLSLLNGKDIERWILHTMPNVQRIVIYCRRWAWEYLLPDQRSEKTIWTRTEVKIRNLDDDELYRAKELALSETDSKIPTLCFLEIPIIRNLETINRDRNHVEKKIPNQNSEIYEGWKEEVD